MCVRRDGGPWDVPEGMTFRQWSRTGAPSPPTREDLDYHLTTLFPPVRPRGHLELRMIDAQPGDDGWMVPLAVTAALFDDAGGRRDRLPDREALAERTLGLPAPHNPLYETRPATPSPIRAARGGRHVLHRALAALPRLGATTEVTDAVAGYLERYVQRAAALPTTCWTCRTARAVARTGGRPAHDRPRHGHRHR